MKVSRCPADPAILAQTRVSAERVLDSLKPQLETVDWYTDRWLEDVLNQAYISFDRACERWRACSDQPKNRRIGITRQTDLSCTDNYKKDRAERLHKEAIRQLKLLANEENMMILISILPLLRRRRLFARVQLPPAASIRIYPWAARAQRKVGVHIAPTFLGHIRIWPEILCIPRRLPIPDSQGHSSPSGCCRG